MLPFGRFPGVDTVLGPEMKSTGEVMGIDADPGRALAKALVAGGRGAARPAGRCSSRREPRQARDRASRAKRLADMGFRLLATKGTAGVLAARRDPGRARSTKVSEGGPVSVGAT